MRAEDLFEAMGALDEQLIALSEEDGRRAREAEHGRARKEENAIKAKRKKRAEIYRFAAVAMTTAAAVFIVLTARNFLGARSRSYTQNTAESAEYSLDESAAEEAVQDTFAGGAAELQADPAVSEPDAGTVSKYSAAQDTDAAQKEAPAMGTAPDAAEAAGEKTAVDMLGDLKGDYVKLEIISAKDRANGGERTEPEYTPERETALTAALEDGTKMPTMFVRTGNPVYYVYLTDSRGNVDTVTFYEYGYVGISTFPGFVMEISDESFAAVAEVFE